MLRKLIGNDLRNHVFLSVVTTLFMAICAMLLALTIMLFLNLSGAIDSLMEQAQTPDFLQMHAGEIDREALERFVEGRQDVEQWQVCGFLNLENGIIRLGEKTLEDSTQDNGLCVQGSGFDYLLDMENRLPDVRDGQIYAPVCYRAEYGVREGDAVWIGTRESEVFTVCGIYSDITNGGKTAKAAFREESASAMWSVFYVKLAEDTGRGDWIAEYQERCAAEGITVKIADIAEYVQGTYGQTLSQVELAARAALGIAAAVIALVTFLFLRLSIEQDRSGIALRKALGFTNSEVGESYIRRAFIAALAGLLAGILAGNICGEGVCGMLLKSFGADSFRFVTDRMRLLFTVPAVSMVAVLGAVVLAVGRIREVDAYECAGYGKAG